MKFLRLLIVILLFAGTAHSQPQLRDEAAALFFKANEFYKQEKYDEAIRAYEDVLQRGLASWTVYYNLGNSYFKKGWLGRAVLYYARAKELEPRDPDLNANYRYALSQVGTDMYVTQDLWSRLWRRHLDFYTADEMLLVVFMILFVLVLVHLWALYTQMPAGRKNALLAFLICAFIVYGYGFKLKVDELSGAAIAVRPATVKYEPLENATVYFELSEGMRVKILREEGNWIKVRRADGKLGWVKGESIEKL